MAPNNLLFKEITRGSWILEDKNSYCTIYHKLVEEGLAILSPYFHTQHKVYSSLLHVPSVLCLKQR